ncbi:hypothetical protein AMS68_000678 [Peltaster fructicola]|uniref:DUF7820 domain-containing protein n=1 Tax=Peltaster fructicola TaxID=286661 RepID=A0A6H0XKK0_9PEZI|nr:hypothetical protein AMS68_000678 [Peltaster fructicola]
MDDRNREDEEPLTPTQRYSNVFSDEYEVLDVADGFRPNNDQDDDSTEPIHSAAAHYASNPRMTFSPDPFRRSSTRKSRSYDNPFSSAEDHPDTSLVRTPSTRSSNYAPGLAARALSSASAHHYAGTSSPRLGAAGPSHPYTMYPQGTILRTPSIASASTTRPGRQSLSSRGGPQHPYAMYTQGIADSEDDDDEETAANPVPVGFGLGQNYRRVRGPEGEEQDIIGEYGHAEQLPPYSRYPDDGPEKAPLLAIPEGIHSRAPVEGTDPGMPLMHQQMSRQSRQSMTDASQLQEQSAPLLSDSGSAHTPDESNDSLNVEKKWNEKNWKEKRKTKICCGIRFGWILIALACIGFIFAILVGSLVGYMAGTRSRKAASASDAERIAVSTYYTSLYDVSLIPAPSGPTPVSGVFALTLGPAQATQADCLATPSHRPAWDCNLGSTPAIVMNVGTPAASSATPTASPALNAYLAASADPRITYGAQYQFMRTDWAPLVPVMDNDDPNLGPAYLFQSTYDKVVVLANNTFSYSQNGKRDNAPSLPWTPLPDWMPRRKQLAMSGEQPWFCFFNSTFVEGLVYVQRPAVMSTTPAATQTRVTTTSATSMTSATSAASSAVITQKPTNVEAYWNQRIAESIYEDHRDVVTARDAQPSYQALSAYPLMVKLEERRPTNVTTQPYCQLYQILYDGGYNPVPNSQGQPIMFFLEQTDSHDAMKDKRDVAGSCHCQWMHGAP